MEDFKLFGAMARLGIDIIESYEKSISELKSQQVKKIKELAESHIGVKMRRCKECGVSPELFMYYGLESASPTEYIYQCPLCKGRVSSTKSKKNAQKLWDRDNTVTKIDVYDAIRTVTGFQFLDDKCEEIRQIVLEYEDKIYEVDK